MAKKPILIINYYRNQKYLEPLRKAILEEAKQYGLRKDHIEVRDYKEVKQDPSLIYGRKQLYTSGSGVSWSKKGKKDTQGKEYITRDDPVAREIAKSGIPTFAVCGSAQTIAHSAYNINLVDSGKYNRGADEKGHTHNNKYHIPVKDARNKIKVLSEGEHAGQRYVKQYQAGNVTGFQYHPERSGGAGRKHIRNFLKKVFKEGRQPLEYVSEQYHQKAA